MLSLYIGYASGVTDEYEAGRIKAITSLDKNTPYSKIPWAFPALPKMLHVRPKNGEAVIVIVSNDEQANSQRYYIGPLISQAQNLFYDDFASFSATKMLNGGLMAPSNSIQNNALSNGIFPENEEIALIGRKNSEIIIGDNDIRLRAGVRVTDDLQNQISLNGKGKISNNIVRTAPAFIKISYYDEPLRTNPSLGEINPHTETKSTVTIVGDKINLISPNGSSEANLTGEGEAISDEKMKKIIETAHKLPYGDVLCELLADFMTVFRTHVHPYPGMPPVEDPAAAKFWAQYTPNKNILEDKVLSKDVRIN